jgi:hypothetical protein
VQACSKDLHRVRQFVYEALQCEVYMLHASFFVSLSILSNDAVDTAGVVQPSRLSPDVFRSQYVAAYLMASAVVQLVGATTLC